MIHCPTEYNKISARIRIQLKQFENEATQLDKKLQASAKNRLITRKTNANKRIIVIFLSSVRL